jgi:hypothetical protein
MDKSNSVVLDGTIIGFVFDRGDTGCSLGDVKMLGDDKYNNTHCLFTLDHKAANLKDTSVRLECRCTNKILGKIINGRKTGQDVTVVGKLAQEKVGEILATYVTFIIVDEVKFKKN